MIRGIFASAILLPISFSLVGCSNNKTKDKSSPTLQDEGRSVFDADGSIEIPETGDETTQWSIVLVALPDPSLAAPALASIKANYNLVGAYITTRNKKTVIAYGRYPGPTDQQALLDLDRIHELTSPTNSRPFAAAFLAPPPAEALGGESAQFNLRTVKERFGPSALYTLQLGVYGRNDNQQPTPQEIAEFRKAAELAVAELRADGDRAFYYHGPVNSTITVGVLGSNDFDSSTHPPLESPRLKDLRAKFPYNYLNGQGIRETVTTSTGQRVTRLQPSALVGIPNE